MFWKYNSPSSVQIDALLQQENVSLQELMDEDELLQECISQNKKVIDYLIQPETLEALVTYVVTDPSPDRELKIRFKYANLASELLTSDVPAIVEKVASSSNLLLMLYQFLEKEKPLNPLLASFVSKVFGMLVQRRSEQNWYSYQFTCFQVLDFLKSRGDFVELAVKHIGTSAIMDLLIKLICGVDDDNQELKRGIHQWLNESYLVEQLVDKLAPDCDSEEHSSVDQLLCELITKSQDSSNGGSDSQTNGSQSRLLNTLESKDVINKLMDTLLHEERSESSVSHVINILLTLLAYRGSHKQSNIHHNSVDAIDGDLDSRNTVLKTVVARLPDLQKILKQPTKLGKLITAYGMEVERLGSTRLKVVSLIASLIATQDAFVHKEMASLKTLQLLFELFFKFSLNNFLHTQVTHCIACILSKPLINMDGTEMSSITQGIDGLNNNPKQMENGEREPVVEENDKEMGSFDATHDATHEACYHPLLIQLFSECSIVQKILECYAMEEESVTEKRLHNMIGYMGHIREMANDIVQYSKEGPCASLIQNEMKKVPDDVITHWEEFTLIGLAEVNLRNKIIPLQMPGVSHRDSEDDSEEEFQSIESLVIMNKGFKEGDMDTLGDMPFVEEFKEDEDALNSGTQRLSPTHMVGVSSSSDANLDDGIENNFERFEEMCAERTLDINQFDDMWKDKEKTISFQNTTEPDIEEEEEHHSSSEEEGDIDDEFDNIRSSGEKMEVEFTSQEWSEVFDKRGNAINAEPGFNPWQSAPASDTSGNNSWADFGGGTSPFNSSINPFSQADNKCSKVSDYPSSNILSSSSKPSEFDADFSNAFFSSSVKSDNSLGTQAAFPAFSDDPSHLKDDISDAQSVPVSSGLGSLHDVCDVTKTVSSVQPTDDLSEEVSTIKETVESMEVENAPAETSCGEEDKKETAENENNSKCNSSNIEESLFKVDAPQSSSSSSSSNIESSKSDVEKEIEQTVVVPSEVGKEPPPPPVSSIIEVQSSQNISMED